MQWGLNEREHDRGRCPWKANAASIAYEYTLLIFILQVLLNYFCSKVTDDESESLGFGSERAKYSDKNVGAAERILDFFKVGVWPVSSAWWIRFLNKFCVLHQEVGDGKGGQRQCSAASATYGLSASPQQSLPGTVQVSQL